MKRQIRFLAMFILLPPTLGFAWVYIKALLGMDFDAEIEWTRGNSYVSGLVVGVWLWGSGS